MVSFVSGLLMGPWQGLSSQSTSVRYMMNYDSIHLMEKKTLRPVQVFDFDTTWWCSRLQRVSEVLIGHVCFCIILDVSAAKQGSRVKGSMTLLFFCKSATWVICNNPLITMHSKWICSTGISFVPFKRLDLGVGLQQEDASYWGCSLSLQCTCSIVESGHSDSKDVDVAARVCLWCALLVQFSALMCRSAFKCVLSTAHLRSCKPLCHAQLVQDF